jgi:peptidoglycan/LPS O-acetylase OafA/YrhL
MKVIKDHLYAHTGLRGLAALMVAPLHMQTQQFLGDELYLDLENFLFILPSVDLFFMLSGFILAYVYIFDELKWKEFFIARFARLFPLHLLTLFCVVLLVFGALTLGVQKTDYSFYELPIQLLLLQSLPYFESRAWNGPAWSVSMELAGYLIVFPLLYGVFNKVKCNSFYYVLLGICLVAVHLHYKYHAEIFASLILGWGAFLRFFYCFIIGFCISVLSKQNQSITHWLVARNTTVLLICTSILVLSRCIDIPLFVVYSSLGLLLWAFSNNSESIGSKILGSKALVFLGVISYSVYMWHNFIGKIVYGLPKHWIFWETGGFSGFLVYAVIMIALVLGSWISYNFYENISRQFITKRLSRKPKL